MFPPPTGYLERCFFNCGVSYLGGMIGGGIYGTVQGLRASPARANFRVRSNAVMNGFGKHGSTVGNSAGVLALMFTSFESLCESAELDKLCGDNDFVRSPASESRRGPPPPRHANDEKIGESNSEASAVGERTPKRAF